MRFLLLISLSMLLFSSCLKKEDYRIHLDYYDEQLRFIQVPHGGIGTGNILVNGYGSIREIEIFNRASRDELPPEMMLFTIYAKEEGKQSEAMVLEGEMLSEFPNPFGRPRQQLGGLPRFREVEFRNAYPAVQINLVDERIPLEVKQRSWSPFIPVDPDNSSLPVAVIEWIITNPGKDAVDYSIGFTMENPLKPIGADGKADYSGCYLTPVENETWSGFEFGNPQVENEVPDAGAFRVSFPKESVRSMPLYNGGWWDQAHIFWNDFSDDGELQSREDTVVNEDGRASAAAMNISGQLKPGETDTIPFIFTWYIPYRKLENSMAFGNKQIEGAVERNYYAKRFPSLDSVTSYTLENFLMLRNKTIQFSDAMITSSVPAQVLDAAISNLSALKTNLMMQDANGNLHGFEGLGNDFGCCPGNCTHVWNYAQAMASVFPSLERNVRFTSYKFASHWNGYQCFRTVFPLGESYFKNVAADGQMGNIMRVYREWKMSGDDVWLTSIWADVKACLEFAWKGPGELPAEYEWMRNCPVPWDPYMEGVMRGDQHNTYDINFFGPNMMTGSLYLGALKASSEMALAMNEPQKSIEYEAIYEKGRKKYMEILWNGEFFTQNIELIPGVEIPDHLKSPPDENGQVLPKYQFGEGCLSDQLLGQYLAFVSGLGYLLDTSVVEETLRSIYRYNFREEMREFDNVQRIYAAGDESGLILCSWPNEDKPLLPFVYSDEVWTGVEYQVAASCIYAGLVDEGLDITKGVRERYSGNNRNPFSEIESGGHYARSLSSWAVYQAMAGYSWDANKKQMTFSPAEDILPMRYFWSTSTGWGTISMSRGSIELICLSGEVELEKLSLKGKSFFVFREFIASEPVEIEYSMNSLNITFLQSLFLKEGDQFRLDLP